MEARAKKELSLLLRKATTYGPGADSRRQDPASARDPPEKGTDEAADGVEKPRKTLVFSR